MTSTPPRLTFVGHLIRFCQPYWLRGLENDPDPGPPEGVPTEALAVARATPCDLIAVFPTHIGRDPEAALTALTPYAAQLVEAAATHGIRIGLVIGVEFQHEGDHERARLMAARLGSVPHEGLAFALPILLRSRIKVDSLNAGLDIAQSCGARAQLWIDDDIEIEPGGMTALIGAWLDPANAEAWDFGLRRTAYQGSNWVARANAARRTMARPQKHAYGCCLLVRTDAPNLPIARFSDDTWMAASLIDPTAADPFHRQMVVDSHEVRYAVPEGLQYALSRVRRIHTNQIMTLARITPEQAQIYATQAMFGGIFMSKSGGLKQYLRLPLTLGMQLVGRLAWIGRAKWLCFRGMIGWPQKRPPWAVDDKYRKPEAPSEQSTP